MQTQTRTQVVVMSNMYNNTYFFSKNHCQEHGLGTDYVPCTHYFPRNVTPRKSVPNGIINSVEDLVSVFYDDMNEIPNPDKNMQPTF